MCGKYGPVAYKDNVAFDTDASTNSADELKPDNQ